MYKKIAIPICFIMCCILPYGCTKNNSDQSRCIEVVNKIADNEIVIPDSGIVKLPASYKDLSAGGIVYANKNTNRVAVAFKTWRGKGRNMRGFLYLTSPLQPAEIKKNYYDQPYLHVGPADLTLDGKIDDNCYKVSYGLD